MAMRMLAELGRWMLAVAIGLTGALHCGEVQAEGKPSGCVAALKRDYGSTNALRSECKTGTDCTFQAPPANASALALIGTMVKRTEDCFAAAGLKVSKEETAPGGTTRYYEAAGAAEKCALLIATGLTGIAEGVRAVCQPVK